MNFFRSLTGDKPGVLGRFTRMLMWSAKRYSRDDCSQRAVALTYYTLFAIVPVAAMLFGVAKGFNLEELLRAELTEKLWQHKELLDWVYKFADTTLKEAQGGVVAGVGIIALVWTVLWLATNIEKAFNDVWNLPSRKNIFRRFSDYLAIILLTPVMLVVVGGAGMALRTWFEYLENNLPGLKGLPTMLFSLGGDLAPVLFSVLIFTLIYFMVPNTRVRFKGALLGGIVAGVLFQLMQDGFLLLQSHLFRYNRIYGSFAALPLFLIWLQWSWQLILLGAEIGFVAQNLDSGIFDEQGNSVENQRLRRLDQLVLAAEIYRNFAENQGPTRWGELIKKLNRPASRLENEVAELESARIVFSLEKAGGERGLVPGFPTETFTAAELLAQLDGFTADHSRELGEELQNYDKLLHEFSQVLQHSSCNIPLAQIAPRT